MCSVALLGPTFSLAALLSIDYQLEEGGRVSLAVYDAKGTMVRTLKSGVPEDAGQYHVDWDGLDHYGHAVAPGTYQWRLLRTPGLEAQYIGMLGTNAVPNSYDHWFANHSMPVSAVSDGKWLYLGGMGENVPASLCVSLDGNDLRWTAHQRFAWARDESMALAGDLLFSLSTHKSRASVHAIDPQDGQEKFQFDVIWDEKDFGTVRQYQMTTAGQWIVIAYPEFDALRWYEPAKRENKKAPVPFTKTTLAKPVDMIGTPQGMVYVISDDQVLRVEQNGSTQTIIDASRLHSPYRIAYVAKSNQLLIAERGDSHVVKRFDIATGKLLRTYGRAGGRLGGVFIKTDFLNICDVADDGHGGFIVQEGGHGALRRTVRMDAQGKHVRTWYGSPQFFNYACPDPADPSRIFYRSDEGSKTLAQMDLKTGQWEVLEDYPHTDFDGMFPSPGHYSVRWQVHRRGDELYLFGNSGRVWGVVRVDRQAGKLVPLASAGVWNKYHKEGMSPLLAQALKADGQDPVKLKDHVFYSWSDRNADGQLTVEEVRIAKQPQTMTPIGWQVYTDENWNMRLTTLDGWLTLPNANAQSSTDIPDWDIQALTQTTGWDITKHERPDAWRACGIMADQEGNVYQSLEGQAHPNWDRPAAGWPTVDSGSSRMIKRRADGSMAWVVGKHAVASPGSTIYQMHQPGEFHDLRDILGIVNLGGVNDCVLFGDRVVRPVVAYTQDGLYAGSIFDRHVDDGLPRRVYCWWRDGVTLRDGVVPYDVLTIGSIAQIDDNQVIWYAMGNQNTPVFRIRGWKNWQRMQGALVLEKPAIAAKFDGTGLTGRYYDNLKFDGQPITEQVDSSIWFALRDKRPVHGNWQKEQVVTGLKRDKPFAVRWTGTLVAPYTEPFKFAIINASQTRFTDGEKWHDDRGGIRMWINGRPIINRWHPDAQPDRRNIARPESSPVNLVAGQQYQITVEYGFWGDEPAELSLLWESPTLERQRLASSLLYPNDPTHLPHVKLISDGKTLHEGGDQVATVSAQIDKPLDHDLRLPMQLLELSPHVLEGFLPELTITAGQLKSNVMQLNAVQDQQPNASQWVQITPAFTGQWMAKPGESVTQIPFVDDEALPSEELVLHWSLDEMDAKFAPDETPFEQFGEMVNGNIQLRDDAVFGRALYLNGDGNYLRQRALLHDLAGKPYSISIWFKPQSKDAALVRLWKHARHSPSVWMQDGLLYAFGPKGERDLIKSQSTVSLNRWHHLAQVVNQSGVTVYLDGQIAMTKSAPTQLPLPGSLLEVGKKQPHPKKVLLFKGMIDDVRIYARMLDDSEVQKLYQAGLQALKRENDD